MVLKTGSLTALRKDHPWGSHGNCLDFPYRGGLYERKTKMQKMIFNNWVRNLLAPAMKANGCPSEINTPDDVIENLFYLSKEDSRGSRFIPLQYKRMIEKMIFGLFSTGFEYKDKEDVYFEQIGETTVCCAHVFFVQFLDDGNRKVLGHGFHCLSFEEVMPGVFLSEAERISKWKSTVIGGAKSRALYDAGIGLEFYGDIYAPEENLDEQEVKPGEKKDEPKKAGAKEKVYSDTGMPIPQPKRKTAVKETSEKKEEASAVKTPEAKEEPGISLEVAKTLKADCGNYAGMSLGEIYETAPKNLVFLLRNSRSEDVKHAATVIISSDEELRTKYA